MKFWVLDSICRSILEKIIGMKIKMAEIRYMIVMKKYLSWGQLRVGQADHMEMDT